MCSENGTDSNIQNGERCIQQKLPYYYKKFIWGGLSYLLGPCQVQTRMSQVVVLISGETNLDNTQEGAVLCPVLHS